MAVVQISRIQVRRGKANSGTGFPQLASGELAWSVDTQELYIGNGSVSEGAPQVGNTKIVTQADLSSSNSLFGIIQYTYKPTQDITVQDNAPVVRTLQEKLDDNVTTTDFGTLGTYNIQTGIGVDDTNALQFAINQLFLNAAGPASGTNSYSVSSRIILQIPAGVYQITSPLYIPSYVSLIGAGQDKTTIYYNPPTSTFVGTVLNNSLIISTTSADNSMVGQAVSANYVPTGTTIVSVVPGTSVTLSQAVTHDIASGTFTLTPTTAAFQFVNDTSSAGHPSILSSTLGINQPRNIQISGMTINTAPGLNTALQLDAVKNSLFEDLHLVGNWGTAFFENSRGIAMNAVSNLVTTENNIFRNIRISGFGYAVYAKNDTLNNIFENCHVSDTRYGFNLGVGANGTTPGEVYGPRQTHITNCKFYNVKWQGVYIGRGEYNTVSDCTFINVGVSGASNIDTSPSTVRYPQIFFNSHGNNAINNNSDRVDDLELQHFDIFYAPAFTGHGVFNSCGTRSSAISGNSGQVLRLPVRTDAYGAPSGSMIYTINYVFVNTLSNLYTRSGSIVITADIDRAKIQLSDEYNFAGTDINVDGYAVALDFSAAFLDQNGSTYVNSPQVPSSILVSFANTGFNISGNFIYSYTAVM